MRVHVDGICLVSNLLDIEVLILTRADVSVVEFSPYLYDVLYRITSNEHLLICVLLHLIYGVIDIE